MAVIKSVYFDQEEILKAILELHVPSKDFCVDLTYGNGKFYTQSIPQPHFKFDKQPLYADVGEADSSSIPLDDSFVGSVVFDPPFLTYIKRGREHNSVMAKRFGGYWSYGELEEHYKGTLKESYRILKNNGIMVFKCQDIVHNHKLIATHINVVNWAKDAGFRLKDLFVLAAKHRMPLPDKDGEAPKKQKHARIHHSYFLVLEKNKWH